jgi:hypothetical protein
MSNTFVAPQGTAQVSIPANESIALYSITETQVFEVVGYPNYPSQNDLEATFTGYTVLGPYTAATTLIVEAGPAEVEYQVGVAPVVAGVANQGAPTSQNTTATLTTAQVMSGIVTSTHATGATITLTLPNGADMELASQFDVNEYFDWVVINNASGAGDTVTIANAASGNNVSGPAVIAISTSAIFRTRKTAADTFVTYRIG